MKQVASLIQFRQRLLQIYFFSHGLSLTTIGHASLVTYNFFLIASNDLKGGQIVQRREKPFKEVDKPFDLDYFDIF
ncbi:hypothetical protein SAMN05216167_102352 [Spirosoma endophyticum]|uniref:Uncharacterized protein n=1 Tax=Spirosoma endophyticum TaxID=662367 RepID=A0A1I1M4L6_9BACT|nr:hypothetical protein SAMN05216167_102352 [Spirosoma endophyticum]